MTEQERRVFLPTLLPWQQQVKSEARRFNVVDIGRRAGKTTLGYDLAADPAIAGKPVGWFSPTYKDMLDVWRDLRDLLQPITSRVNIQERRIELLTGGVIEFWSLDKNVDAGRGRKYARAIVDEGAKVPKLLRTFTLAIRPTLADYGGDFWVLSTPQGLNDFWTMYRRGEDDEWLDWQSWMMPTSVNPYIPAEEIAAAKAGSLDLEFRQEWLAEFVDEAGQVFRRVTELSIHQPAAPVEGRSYTMGVDLASTTDYTALAVIDATDETKRQVYADRWRGIPWGDQLGRIRAVFEDYQPDVCAVDRTGIGDMPFQELAKTLPSGLVWGVAFNAGNKMDMVQKLGVALERAELELLDHSVQTAELLSYEAKRKPSGVWSYNAPAGQHDDTVIALMLAWDGVLAGQVRWEVYDD